MKKILLVLAMVLMVALPTTAMAKTYYAWFLPHDPGVQLTGMWLTMVRYTGNPTPASYIISIRERDVGWADPTVHAVVTSSPPFSIIGGGCDIVYEDINLIDLWPWLSTASYNGDLHKYIIEVAISDVNYKKDACEMGQVGDTDVVGIEYASEDWIDGGWLEPVFFKKKQK